MLRAEPVHGDVVVGLHESPGEQNFERVSQVVPADEVPSQVLAVSVRVTQADIRDDVVGVAADALVGEDGEADETQAKQAEGDADDICPVPVRPHVITTHVLIRAVAVDCFDFLNVFVADLSNYHFLVRC